MSSSMVCEPFPAPPATPALSAAELDSEAAAAAAAVVAAKAHGSGGGAGSGDTIPLPPHVGAPGALGGSPKSHRGEGPQGGVGRGGSSSSPLSQSPQRQALPPLPLKQLGRSVSNPVISTSKQRAAAAAAAGAGGLHGRGPLRKGKWTPEEEIYAHYIIDNFNKGLISLSRGTTLRSYLSDKLNCDPMRVTKKFSGTSCIGKSVFCPAEPTAQNLELIKVVARRLEELEHNFKHKVESHPPYGATAAAAQAHAQQLQLKQLVAQHGLAGPLTPHPHLSKARYHAPPPPPPPLLPPPPPLARSLSASAGSSSLNASSSSSRAAIPPPPPPQLPHLPAAAFPPQLGGPTGSGGSGGPSPPRPPSTALLTSRHSMPDLVAAAAAGAGGDGYGVIGGSGGTAERREYRRPAPLAALGAGAGHKRGRGEVEDLSLDDHDAGDLLVNFFASVHKTYSVGSLHDMDTAAAEAADNPPAIPRHRALSYPTTPAALAAGTSTTAASPSAASSPSASEATFLPEPSPTGALPSPVMAGAGGGESSPGGRGKEEVGKGAEEGGAAKRAKVVMERC